MSDLMEMEQVYLNVYEIDLIPMWPNNIFWMLGFGIYHSGVQVYEKEYTFHGHPYDFSGIFTSVEPKCEKNMGRTCTYKISIPIGYTNLSRQEVYGVLNDLGDVWKGPTYHLMRNNCNHFTNTFCEILCNKGNPDWVNRLAKFTSLLPFIELFVPSKWIKPPDLTDSMQNIHVRLEENDSDNNKEEYTNVHETECINKEKINKGKRKYGKHRKNTTRISDTKNQFLSTDSESDDENIFLLSSNPSQSSCSISSSSSHSTDILPPPTQRQNPVRTRSIRKSGKPKPKFQCRNIQHEKVSRKPKNFSQQQNRNRTSSMSASVSRGGRTIIERQVPRKLKSRVSQSRCRKRPMPVSESRSQNLHQKKSNKPSISRNFLGKRY